MCPALVLSTDAASGEQDGLGSTETGVVCFPWKRGGQFSFPAASVLNH